MSARSISRYPSIFRGIKVSKTCWVSWLSNNRYCAHHPDDIERAHSPFIQREAEAEPDTVTRSPATANGLIYFHRHTKTGQAENIRIVPAINVYFDKYRSGKNSNSLCFEADNTPVFEVLLLVALKRKENLFREYALSRLPYTSREWVELISDNIFNENSSQPYRPDADDIYDFLETIVSDKSKFQTLAGKILCEAAKQNGALKKWADFEALANKVANNEGLKPVSDQANKSAKKVHFVFNSLESEALLYGLPCKTHINQAWDQNGADGDIRHSLSKLGFNWLPRKSEWNKNWKPKLASPRIGSSLLRIREETLVDLRPELERTTSKDSTNLEDQ